MQVRRADESTRADIRDREAQMGRAAHRTPCWRIDPGSFPGGMGPGRLTRSVSHQDRLLVRIQLHFHVARALDERSPTPTVDLAFSGPSAGPCARSLAAFSV